MTITDNRTGKRFEVPIQYGTYPTYGAAIAASDLRQIKVSDEDFGLLAYDPGFTNTAACRSSITFVDGERGFLRYRGYPIQDLSERSTYLETAYLLLHGELPRRERLDQWVHDITHHKKGERGRLMGFGHRVYKNYDPRANIIKKLADEVLSVTRKNPLLEIALELERIALEDDYFVTRGPYPNVDFYSGIIYPAMGFPVDIFPVLFAIPRTAGWLAQWQEMLLDEDTRIARPRQAIREATGATTCP